MSAAREGRFTGAVLDAGCGTGENALHLASLGLGVTGVDVAETALEIARRKAEERGIEAEFTRADALHLSDLERIFDTVLDCGLFHTFGDDERRAYVASLAAVTRPDGSVHLLCFSDVDRVAGGPHPVSEKQLRAAFTSASGWNITAITSTRLQTRFHDDGVPAWLATIERL